MLRLAALLILLISSVAAAADTQLEDVTVHGEQEATSQEGADLTVSTTTIDMSRYEDQLVTVAEVLDQVAGVNIRRFGGLDDFATVSIRGSTAEQVQIYLDGVPLNQASGGGVNLATIPAGAIESITIYRGQAPIRFGTSAIGGVISIRTKEATRYRTSEIRASYGSLNTVDTVGLYSQGFDKTDYLVSYEFSRSDGDFTYRDDNGTPINPDDDQTLERMNNQFDRHDALVKFGAQISPSVSLNLHNDFFYENHGVPGLGTLKSDDAELKTLRNITSAPIEIDRLKEDNFNIRVQPLFSYNKSQFQDLNGDIGLGVQDNDDDTYLYGGDITTDTYWGMHQHWTFYNAYYGEQFLPENKVAPQRTGQKSVRNRVTVGAEDEITLWNDRLLINPLLRFEMIFNDLSADDPSLITAATPDNASDFPVTGKIGMRLRLIDHLDARGSFGRAFRVPSFLELFGDRGFIVGNPGLKPEDSWNWDFGLIWQQKKYAISATYYASRVDNLIQFLQTSQFTARAENLGSASIEGAEFEARATLPLGKDDVGAGPRARPTETAESGPPRGGAPTIQMNANYTFQWAKDTSGRNGFDGKFLPGRPQHQLHVGSTVQYKWFRWFASYDFIAANFLDSFNVIEVSSRSLLEAGMGYRPVKWVELSIDVKNILDQQVEDVLGFPVPGRLIFGLVTLNI